MDTVRAVGVVTTGARLTPELVREFANHYPADADRLYFDHLLPGRAGNREALYELTKWKNTGTNDEPMDCRNHAAKYAAFEYFVARLPTYLDVGGSQQLRSDFSKRAPVWAMLWHHVLYGTPIFDRYTNMAYRFFATGKRLTLKEAALTVGEHWQLYDAYTAWFRSELTRLQAECADIDDRTLDRALFMWGREEDQRQANGTMSEAWSRASTVRRRVGAKEYMRACLRERGVFDSRDGVLAGYKLVTLQTSAADLKNRKYCGPGGPLILVRKRLPNGHFLLRTDPR